MSIDFHWVFINLGPERLTLYITKRAEETSKKYTLESLLLQNNYYLINYTVNGINILYFIIAYNMFTIKIVILQHYNIPCL